MLRIVHVVAETDPECIEVKTLLKNITQLQNAGNVVQVVYLVGHPLVPKTFYKDVFTAGGLVEYTDGVIKETNCVSTRDVVNYYDVKRHHMFNREPVGCLSIYHQFTKSYKAGTAYTNKHIIHGTELHKKLLEEGRAKEDTMCIPEFSVKTFSWKEVFIKLLKQHIGEV